MLARLLKRMIGTSTCWLDVLRHRTREMKKLWDPDCSDCSMRLDQPADIGQVLLTNKEEMRDRS
jgi:hypothetical protein